MTNIITSQIKTNIIDEQFNHIITKIRKSFKPNETELSFLDNVGLMFDNKKNPRYSAYASAKDPFNFLNEQDLICFATDYLDSYVDIIIHELAHLILDRFLPQCVFKNGGHCLEFAIVNYSILYRLYYYDNEYNKCFFRSYDIHEDKAYPNISINPCKFDSLIKSIEWQTIGELTTVAEKMAKKIRKNLVV